MDNWYLYKHIRLDKDEPFYIGIGNKPNFFRAFERDPRKRNKIWRNITSKTGWVVEIIASGITKEEASIREQIFIRAIGRIDLGTGPLSNLTDGGDGIHNCKRSEETKLKLRNQKLGPKNPQFGKKQSAELIEKRTKWTKGYKCSDEIKENHRIGSIKSGQAKSVSVYNFSTGKFLGSFVSLSLACQQFGLGQKLSGKASLVARGFRNHVHDYKFVYD